MSASTGQYRFANQATPPVRSLSARLLSSKLQAIAVTIGQRHKRQVTGNPELSAAEAGLPRKTAYPLLFGMMSRLWRLLYAGYSRLIDRGPPSCDREVSLSYGVRSSCTNFWAVSVATIARPRVNASPRGKVFSSNTAAFSSCCRPTRS